MATNGNMFGANESRSIIYRAGFATVSIGGQKEQNAVFLGVNIQVGRQLTPLATLGQGIRWASQPPSGQLTAQTILTSSKALVDQLTGDGCKKLTFEIDLTNAECGEEAKGGAAKLSIKDGYCSQIGFNASAQQGYIGSDLTIMFTACSLS